MRTERRPGRVRRPGDHRRAGHQRRARADPRLRDPVPAQPGPARRSPSTSSPTRRPATSSPSRSCRSSPTWTSGSTATRSSTAGRLGEDRLLQPAGRHRVPSPIGSVEDFVADCMPGLRGARSWTSPRPAASTPAPTTWSADDDFILGPVPGADGVFAGVGWRGTGYKFAPWVGRVLAQLAVAAAALSTTSAGSRPAVRPLGRPRSGRQGDHDQATGSGLEQRLADGVVLGAEGYVFELERRGYIKAGPYVPEVVLDFPDAVRELHREFLRAGRRRDGRADLLRAPREAAARRPRGRPGGDEPPGRPAGRAGRAGGRRAGGRQRLQHLGLRSGRPRDQRGGAGAVRRAAGLGGRGGHRLRDLRDQRLPGRGADRAGGEPGARPAGHGDARPRRSRTGPGTATTTSRRAGSWPITAPRSSG